MPRRYKSIVVCGGFGLGGSRAHDQEALRRFFVHLEPGGALLLDNYLPYNNPNEWRFWTAEGQQELPLPWPEEGNRKTAAGGDEIELRGRLAALDPLEQLATRELRAYLWRDGRLVNEEAHTLLERFYFKHDLMAMLAAAGFGNVAVLGDYTDSPATERTGIVVYVATKPEA